MYQITKVSENKFIHVIMKKLEMHKIGRRREADEKA
jgi:hypothetical protein